MKKDNHILQKYFFIAVLRIAIQLDGCEYGIPFLQMKQASYLLFIIHQWS